MRRVIVESPYAGDVARNMEYANDALRNCLTRGEAPFASHVLYTTALDDSDPSERLLGIIAGLAWAATADATVVYMDLGISEGMRQGIAHAKGCFRPVEYRSLPAWSGQPY